MPPVAPQKPAAAFTRALNSAAATAISRVVILCLPFLCSLGLWAGHRYLAEQVATSPVVVELRQSQSKSHDTHQALAERVRELEEARRHTETQNRQLTSQLERIGAKLDGQGNQINRLVGAFEARGIIPRAADPYASTHPSLTP